MDALKEKMLFWIAHDGGTTTLGKLQRRLSSVPSARRRALLAEMAADGYVICRMQLKPGRGRTAMVVSLTETGWAYVREILSAGAACLG